MNDTLKASLELLLEEKFLLVFPENAEMGEDTMTHIRPFQKTVFRLGEMYYEQRRKRLEFYPVAIHESRKVMVGKPYCYNPLNVVAQERLRLRDLAEASVIPTLGVSTETTGTDTDSGLIGTATLEAGLSTATSETAAGGAGATDTTVRISTSTSTAVSQPFLVDQQGRALYLFTTDTQNGGTSACTAECLMEWQPLIVTGTPQAGQGVDAGLLGTITREDGTLQATYNGWPLYTYSGDAAPGSTSGQGIGNAWFLVSGTGNSIQQ